MQMCPDCGSVYDESEYSHCPYCYDDDSDLTSYIVYDEEAGETRSLSASEYEEFKTTHPEYH